MAHRKDKSKYYEQMLFNDSTSYRDTYVLPPYGAHFETRYKEVPKRERLPPKGLKYVESMVEYRKRVPFNIFHKPKEIVQTNPHVPQTPFTKEHHKNEEEAIRTRPRLVIGAQFPIDDIQDKNARKIIINDTYTSTLADMTSNSKPYLSVKAPLPEMPSSANPIALRKLRQHFISPEFKMETLHWDRRQLRGECPATRILFRIREDERIK